MENVMGKHIHAKRIESNLTMEELGARLGVQKSAINKWEKGMVTNIKRSTIQIMSEIFDCSPVWLMGLDDAPEEVPQYNPLIQDFIDVLPKLTDEQINSLLNMARLFAVQNDAK